MAESGWKNLYKVGGTTALIALMVPLAEVAINYLPGVASASQRTATVVDWFALFQNHWLLGLRNLVLLNLIGAALLGPTILAIYAALRRGNKAYAAFGTILFFIGMAVYVASNRAFPMLSLSRQYARATTDAQRSLLIAVGQTLLAEGQSRAGILLIELVPLVEKNPAYFVENSYDAVDAHGNRIEEAQPKEETLARLRNGQLYLRQRPGEENSLGLVKFELPNPYDVYLHGTPEQELFSESRRDISHGCVRVEDPVALAVWVLRDNPGWDQKRVEASMHGNETLRVALVNPVPVWIVYGTTVVLEDGRIRFYKDIYGEDEALERELTHTREIASIRD